MDRALVIESDEAVRLAEELSAITGSPQSTAVIVALRDAVAQRRLARERYVRIRAASEEFRRHLHPPLPSSDHDWLYDENGLPA